MVRRLLSATTVLIAAVGLGWFATGRASAEPPRAIAACSSRACLLVLHAEDDADGDGFTDADEEALGTDPNDPDSHPPALDAVKLLLERRLPSFERHLTELVVLPTLTPDGQALETGLGEFNLRDHDASLLNTFFDITSTFERNGLDEVFALKAAVSSDTGVLKELVNHPAHEMAWASSGWSTMSTYAPYLNGGNSGQGVSGIEDKGASYSDGMLTVDYNVSYTNGSRDQVTQAQDLDSGKRSASVLSYDAEGNLSKSTFIETSTKDNGDGTTTTTVFIDEKWYKDGSQTGRTVTKATTTTYSDGSTVTETKTETYDEGGRLVDETTVVESKCNAAKANCEGGETVDKFVDPDYVEFAVNSPEALAALEARIKNVSQPAPDTGEPGPGPGNNPEYEWNPAAEFKLVALYDPDDGTTVIAASGDRFTVGFDPLEPDYDPTLAELYRLSDTPEPKQDGGHTTWPS